MTKFILIALLSLLSSLSFAQGTPPVSNNQSLESQILAAIADLESKQKDIQAADQYLRMVNFKPAVFRLSPAAHIRHRTSSLATVQNVYRTFRFLSVSLSQTLEPRIEKFIYERLIQIQGAIKSAEALILEHHEVAKIHFGPVVNTLNYLQALRDRAAALRAIAEKSADGYQKRQIADLAIRDLLDSHPELVTVSSNPNSALPSACAALF